MSIWRYNKITGYWVHERNCTAETAATWLAMWQKDQPERSVRCGQASSHIKAE